MSIENPEKNNDYFFSLLKRLSPAKKTFLILQFFVLLIYLLANLAYYGEAGHFRLTLQLVVWLFGAMFWAIGYFALHETSAFLQKWTMYLSTALFLLADFLILIFIIGMIDFSITDRGYRRILGLVVPISEAPPQVKMATETIDKGGIGKNIFFIQENGKDVMEIKLKYKPIPEDVNFYLNGIAQSPKSFELTSDGKMIISEGSLIKSMIIDRGGDCWVRYSYDTRENRKINPER